MASGKQPPKKGGGTVAARSAQQPPQSLPVTTNETPRADTTLLPNGSRRPQQGWGSRPQVQLLNDQPLTPITGPEAVFFY